MVIIFYFFYLLSFLSLIDISKVFLIIKNFHCFPGSFPRLRIFKIDVSISFTDLLQAVVKNDNMADCFSCSAW